MSNWREILRNQEEDLKRMEEMDAALNEDQEYLDYDIKNILKGTRISSSTTTTTSNNNNNNIGLNIKQERTSHLNLNNNNIVDNNNRSNNRNDSRSDSRSNSRSNSHKMQLNIPQKSKIESNYDDLDDLDNLNEEIEDVHIQTTRSEKSISSPSSAILKDQNLKQAPDTTARLQKARLKGLSKQLEESKELRKQLMDQINDLQKQLKSERDENKQLRKRISILETDNRRASGVNTPRRGQTNSAETSQDELTQLRNENLTLRKDLQTAERIAKQADTQLKTKDTHLKRALETVNKNKLLLEELQNQVQSTGSGDRVKLDEAYNKIKLLEKQRDELIEAFRKQMKLIDILKRQKTHIEAARLLQFTEEEFLKTLDWTV